MRTVRNCCVYIHADLDCVIDIRQLKKVRSCAKGNLSKKQNEIKELMLDPNNLSEIKQKLLDLEIAVKKFQSAHQMVHENLQDEYDILEYNDYFNTEMERIADLKQGVNELCERITISHEILPEDSVSNAGSQHGSRVTNVSKRSRASSRASAASAVSSISASRAKATAKLAMLEARATSLRKRRALQEEQFRLQQVAEELDLETELAVAAAEEKAYFQAEKNELDRYRQEDKGTTLRSSQNKQETPISNSACKAIDPLVETCPIGIESDKCLSSKQRNRKLKEREKPVLSATNQNDDDALERFMLQQKRHASALMLPKPEVPIFDGDPIEYQTFVRTFENLIEANTDSDSARLYYLIQYTRGDVKELMKSCLSMKNEEGYLEARQLLKKRYGQDYKIASSYIERVINGPPIKSENAAALQRFSVLLASCKNMLKDIGYLSKIENLDSMRRIINRLPFALRRSWRDVADAIMERESREVTIDDIAKFVESKARASSHPIFGNISDEVKDNRKEETRRRKEVNYFQIIPQPNHLSSVQAAITVIGYPNARNLEECH